MAPENVTLAEARATAGKSISPLKRQLAVFAVIGWPPLNR
jgi:hypothetical protein